MIIIGMEMYNSEKRIFLLSMPFAGTTIPSIQLPLLEGYLKDRNINIKTRHLYLKAAEYYGLNNYNFLINAPNEPYTAQLIYSKFVFPNHWKKTETIFRKYFEEKILDNKEIKGDFNFEMYIEQTENFYFWVIEHTDWRAYDLIGFTLNYGQFLPSLAIAKKIKEIDPDKKIVFGGSRTIGQLGVKVLEAFDFIDFIVSGDGEESLYLLASNIENYKSIPNLIFKDGKQIIWNQNSSFIDMNSLPIPSYDPFYEELDVSSPSIKEFFNSYGRLPIEISRGCWWNNCSFCSQRILQKKYREKKIQRIINEIEILSKKYKVLDFQLIGDTLLKSEYRHLFKEIIRLNKDYTFFVETRAGQLAFDDYKLMKQAGFTTIQTGVETFSQNYIKKMNKGIRVIDNIAALKFCKENRISNRYNLIVNYPNEELLDFQETKQNIQYIMQYLDPPQISYLIIEYGSNIFENPEKYNIEKLNFTQIDEIMYPEEFLEKGFNFIFKFKRKIELIENNWDQLITDWKSIRERFETEAIKSQLDVDKLVFYFVDGGSFIKIYDKRNGYNTLIYVLNELEREIFISCLDVISLDRLRDKFVSIPEYELVAILQSFEKIGIIFVENDHYLSLPLSFALVHSRSQEIKEKTISYI
jgi:ribosomal peptide maturation radical SAM protein 1